MPQGAVSPLAEATPPRPGSRLAVALLLSLLLHALLLAWLGRSPVGSAHPEVAPIVVSLASERERPPVKQSPPERQIVAPSDRENGQMPTGPAFLSDRNNRVERQTVRRGNPDAGHPEGSEKRAEARLEARPAPPPAPRPRAAPRARPAPAERRPDRATSPRHPAPRPARPLPSLEQLLAPPAEVLARAGARRTEAAGPAAERAAADPHRDLVSAPPPARGLFAGVRGTFDHLPDVAAGHLTMLNTKADRFAPFVRRVGTRVFQNLLIYQRRELDAQDILAANRRVTVRAILAPDGQLERLELVDRSGSHAVDQTLLDALREAAFDQNPPPEAANAEGKYEFIFQAQLLAGLSPGPNGPQLRSVESRLRIGLL